MNHEAVCDDAIYVKKTAHISNLCTFGRRNVLKNRNLKKPKYSESASPPPNDIPKVVYSNREI
jgi:hypothetical protein